MLSSASIHTCSKPEIVKGGSGRPLFLLYTGTMRSSGFTLIELLVVIAIIGMLSSIVLASMNTARTKAADSALQAQLTALRTTAETNYPDGSGGYDSLCAPGTASYTQFSNAVKDTNTAGNSMCLSSGTEGLIYSGTVAVIPKTATPYQWAASVLMRTGYYFCVDYTGAAVVQASRGIDNSPLDVVCN